MEFDVVLFKETFFEMLSPLFPLLFMFVSVNLAMLILSVFRKILYTPASRIYPNIEDDDEYIDEEEREDFHDFDNSIVNYGDDPIKSK